MGAIKNFLVLFILFVSTTTSAQINRYVIHFTDKNNSEFTINNPSAFLSERSLTRRIKNNVSVTEQDFPVTKLYVNELENEGVNVFYTSRWFNVAIVEMDVSLITIIEDLAFVSEVEYVAPGTKLNGRSVDYESKNTKNRTTAGESDFQINYMGADEMHDDGFKGNGILIAVTDAGFTNLNNISQFSHLYNNGKIRYTFDYTVNDINVYLHDDHGTEVFSTMGAFDSGFTGSAPEADYMLFVTEDINSEFRIEEYNWLLAAEFADSAGVDIINASIGYNTFTDASMNYTYEDLDGNTTVISRAAAIAASKGILIVTGSGNEGNTNWRNVLAPGDVETVLTVGSVTGNGNISSFSGVGPTSDGRIKPDLVALGSNVAVINETGNIINRSGTSYSAPQLAGLAAGLMQAYPEMTVAGLIDYLKQSGSQSTAPDNTYGFGIPNYSIFVTLKSQVIPANYFQIYPNPVANGTLELVSVNLLKEQSLEIRFLNTRGQVFNKFIRKMDVTNNSLRLDINFLPQGTYIMQIRTEGKSESFRIIKAQ